MPLYEFDYRYNCRKTLLGLAVILCASFLINTPCYSQSSVADQALTEIGDWSKQVLAYVFLILMSIACVVIAYNHRAGLFIFFSILMVFLVIFLFVNTFTSTLAKEAAEGGRDILDTVLRWILIGCFGLIMIAGLIHASEMALRQTQGLVGFGWVIIAFILFSAVFSGALLSYLGFKSFAPNVASPLQKP